MKISLFPAAYIAVTSLVLVKHDPITTTSSISANTEPVVFLLPKQITSLDIPNQPLSTILTLKSPSIKIPTIDQTPVDYPQQPEPELSDERLKELEDIRATAKKIQECQAENINKCAIFIKAGGVLCTNSAIGTICDTFTPDACDNLSLSACHTFANAKGIFCSEVACGETR